MRATRIWGWLRNCWIIFSALEPAPEAKMAIDKGDKGDKGDRGDEGDDGDGGMEEGVDDDILRKIRER